MHPFGRTDRLTDSPTVHDARCNGYMARRRVSRTVHPPLLPLQRRSPGFMLTLRIPIGECCFSPRETRDRFSFLLHPPGSVAYEAKNVREIDPYTPNLYLHCSPVCVSRRNNFIATVNVSVRKYFLLHLIFYLFFIFLLYSPMLRKDR